MSTKVRRIKTKVKVRTKIKTVVVVDTTHNTKNS